jgi:hypothetical protein
LVDESSNELGYTILVPRKEWLKPSHSLQQRLHDLYISSDNIADSFQNNG